MIHYQLCCQADHAFDGWFRDSASFDAQAAQGLLACPVCGVTQVRRALMAPALARKGAGIAVEPPPKTPAAATPATPATSVATMPDAMRAMLQKMRAEVERSCDYVGPAFATTARDMHDGVLPPRPIYGEATPEQAQRLEDDGIEVAQIPWISRSDS